MAEKTLQERREEATAILEKMDEILNLSEEKKTKILENYDKWEKIRSFYDDVFSELKDIIEDEDSWLEKTHEKAQDALNRIDSLEEEINKKKESLENLETKAKNLWDTNKKLNDELEKMLWVASDKVLSCAFDEQEKKYEKISYIWLWITGILFLIVLWIIAYSIFIFQWNIELLLLKIFITSPIFIASIITFREYLKENKKSDKYGFKKTKASAFESYIELLLSKFLFDEQYDGTDFINVTDKESKKKILAFVLDTMKYIYAEPIYSDKIIELDLKAKIKEYEMNMKISDQEVKKVTKIENN